MATIYYTPLPLSTRLEIPNLDCAFVGQKLRRLIEPRAQKVVYEHAIEARLPEALSRHSGAGRLVLLQMVDALLEQPEQVLLLTPQIGGALLDRAQLLDNARERADHLGPTLLARPHLLFEC